LNLWDIFMSKYREKTAQKCKKKNKIARILIYLVQKGNNPCKKQVKKID